MKQLTFILADSSIEVLPPELIKLREVAKLARRLRKKPRHMLLDRALHHRFMTRLENSLKRGRPDIVHITLLTILESPLNKLGKVRVYVHTLHDYVIEVNPETRLPKNYYRFVGLMEQLFKEGKVPPESDLTLLSLHKMTFKQLIDYVKPCKTILLTEKGKPISLMELSKMILSYDNPAIVIGCFPHGDFREEIYEVCDEKYSIYQSSLEAFIVAQRIISACEIILGII